MLVRDVMHTPAVATTVDASVKDVAVELSFHRFSGLPVDDVDGHVIGIITEADKTALAVHILMNLPHHI